MKLRTVEAKEGADLDKLLEGVQSDETPVVIMRGGKPVAVLIPVSDTDMESISMSLDPQFNALIQERRLSHARDGGISADEMDALFAEDLPEEDERSA